MGMAAEVTRGTGHARRGHGRRRLARKARARRMALLAALAVLSGGSVGRAESVSPAEGAYAGLPAVNLAADGAGEVFVTADGLAMTPVEQWFTATPENGRSFANSYAFVQEFVRVGLGYHFGSGVTFYAEAMSPGLFDLPTNAIARYPQGELGMGATYYAANGSRDAAAVFLKRAFISLDPQQFGGLGLTLGRYEFDDGTEIIPDDPGLRWLVLNRLQQRLIGSRYVLVGGRSLDGGMLTYGDGNRNLTALFGIPTQGSYLVDGNPELNGVDVGYISLNAGPGVLPGWLGRRSLARLFFLHYDDTRGLLLPDNQSLAQRIANNGAVHIETLGGDFLREIAAGPGEIDLMLWGAYQFGQWGKLTQSAYAYNAEFGYHATQWAWQPWLRAAYTVGSGSGNPDSGTHGTFFQVLPTPWYFANFAFYDMENIDDAMLELVLFPAPSLTWRTDVQWLSLNSPQDAWYAGGGAWSPDIFGYEPRPSYGQSSLGTVVETALNWDVNRHVSLSWYFGHVFGGAVVAANYPLGRDANFGFMMFAWHL